MIIAWGYLDPLTRIYMCVYMYVLRGITCKYYCYTPYFTYFVFLHRVLWYVFYISYAQ